MERREVAEFIEALRNNPTLWTTIDVRALAIRTGDEWVNIATRALVGRSAAAESDPLEAGDLAVFRQIFPFEHLDGLIDSVEAGSLEVQGTAISYRRYGGGTSGSGYDQAYARVALPLDEFSAGPYPTGHVLALSGGSAWEPLRLIHGGRPGLDVMVRRAGWHSLDEVCLRVLNDPQSLQNSSTLRAVFIAPFAADLIPAECRLGNGVLSYGVRAADAATASTLSLTVAGEAGGKRQAIEVKLRGRGSRVGDQRIYRGSAKFRGVSSAYLSLHANGLEVRALRVDEDRTVSPLRLATEALFGRGRAFEDVLLAPISSEGRPFERAVCKLFAYAGLPCYNPGSIPTEQNGPDVLVELPGRGALLVIETTLKQLLNDDGKLNRLTKRTADLRLALRDSGIELVPVMIVPWPRETLVPVELDEATRNGVRVLGREDLEELLLLSRRTNSASDISDLVYPGGAKRRSRGFLAVPNPLLAG